jgi:hypothetical protein
MLIAIWSLILISFVVTLTAIVFLLSRYLHNSENFKVLIEGMKTAFTHSGLHVNPPYEVELYRWINTDDADVCDLAKERINWPPMDIADWMQAELPDSVHVQEQCGRQCHCRLIYVGSKRIPKRDTKQSSD